MSAPKKIWVREIPDRENLFCIGLSYHTKPQGIQGETETEYVRADAVNDLVQAVERWFSSVTDWDELEAEVQVALKALKEDA